MQAPRPVRYSHGTGETQCHHHHNRPVTTYEIQALTPHGWAADPAYLGDGLNEWETEADAQSALNELATIAGFNRDELRVRSVA